MDQTDRLYCLGIESTAHTFGISIVDSTGAVVSEHKDMYTTEHGGMKPFDLTMHHFSCAHTLLDAVLADSGMSMLDIDCIAYSQSPGIGNALRVGAAFARGLSAVFTRPLVGVNHCIAHLEIGLKKTKATDPVFLYVSGANTQIIAYDGGRYRIFGETLDMGVGNFLDSFARKLGLGFPGGPKIETLARDATDYIELPYVVKGMDISLGGLLTNAEQKIDSKKYTVPDLCYSVQETAFAMLLEVAERALAHTGKQELLLGGGVACNSRLQEMAQVMTQERGALCYAPDKSLLVDNAAMIAWLGLLQFQVGDCVAITEATLYPYRRTDEVQVNWKS